MFSMSISSSGEILYDDKLNEGREATTRCALPRAEEGAQRDAAEDLSIAGNSCYLV